MKSVIQNSKVQSSSYRGGKFESNSRQRRRHELTLNAAHDLERAYAGRGRAGNLVWPDNMPRRVRRLICRDKAKRLFRESLKVQATAFLR